MSGGLPVADGCEAVSRTDGARGYARGPQSAGAVSASARRFGTDLRTPVRNGLCPAGAWWAARRWRAGTGLRIAVSAADAEPAASPKAYPVDLFYVGGQPAEGLLAAFPSLAPEALDGELESMRKSGVTLIRREPDRALLQEVEGYDAVFVDVSCAPGLAPASRDAVDSVTLNVAGGPEHVCFGGWPSLDGTGTGPL